MDQSPEGVRRGIDEVLAEIDELERDILELFSTIAGPQVAARLARVYRGEEATPGVSRGPSTARRETR